MSILVGVIGLDVYAVVYLRFAFVYWIFTLAVRRRNEHELPALYRHRHQDQ